MKSRVEEPLADSTAAPPPTVRPGLSGAIALLSVESLDAPGLTAALARLGTLVAWAQAGQAEVIHLLEERFQDGMRHNGMAAKAERRGQPESGSSAPAAKESVAVTPPCDAACLRRLRRADEELAESLTATEIACALSLSERTALILLRASHVLCSDFPSTFLALRSRRHHLSPCLCNPRTSGRRTVVGAEEL